MSGLPEVDMNDWEKNTTYANGYDAECPVIVVSKSGLRLIRYDLLYQEVETLTLNMVRLEPHHQLVYF